MRTAIIGGTFSPPHNGHLALAQCAKNQLQAQRVLILPNSSPPHKFCGVDKKMRYEMTGLAFEDFDWAALNDTEYSGQGKSYTFQTMETLKKRFSGDELYFVIGGDSLRDFSSWRSPDVILKNCKLAVAGRSGIELERAKIETEKKFRTVIKVLEMPVVDVSSTLIRINYNFGFDNSEYLPKKVNDFILRNGLYTDYAAVVKRLSGLLKRERFLHSYRVVIAGLEIARREGIDEDKAFIACLLHDCAKNMPAEKWDYYGFCNEENLLPPIVHCALGVSVALEDFKIKDREVLDAIRFHTTCRPDMTQLDKLVFVADKVESSRRYPEVKENFKLALEDLDAAFLTVLAQTYRIAVGKYGESGVDEMTKKAMKFYGLI